MCEHACIIWGRDLRFQPEETTLLCKIDKVDDVFFSLKWKYDESGLKEKSDKLPIMQQSMVIQIFI